MFVDTNIIINILSEDYNPNILALVEEKYKDGRLFISAVVLAEVIAFKDYDETQVKLLTQTIKNTFKIVLPDIEIFELAADIVRYQKQNTGKRFKLTDAIIAATAIVNNSPLLTLDKEDFKNITNLTFI